MSTFLPDTNNPYEFQSHLISGVGPYSDPLSIYSAGHKTYSSNLISGTPDISGVVENINLLNNDIKNPSGFEQIKLFKQNIIEDQVIPGNLSGLSIDLKFTSFNIETEENVYLNL